MYLFHNEMGNIKTNNLTTIELPCLKQNTYRGTELTNLVGVSNLGPTSKIFVRVPSSRGGVHGGHKIYTSSGRMSLLALIDGLCYRQH